MIKNETKKIILGVANSWTERKGLYDFIKLLESYDEGCESNE